MVCNMVRRYAFDTVAEQGSDIGKKVPQGGIDPPDNAADIAGRPVQSLPVSCKLRYFLVS